MKIVLQRVSEAKVTVDSVVSGAIGPGLVIFLCIEKGDTQPLAAHYAEKVSELRIFPDDQGKMNRSLKETDGEALVISQFTLAADSEKGRRPSFDGAEKPEAAEKLYRYFATQLTRHGIRVSTGIFQAYMKVHLVNDGPVTILLGKRKEGSSS